MSALERLEAELAGAGPLVVAYSGGVDSALVLAAALRVLGRDGVLAVTGRSPALAQREDAEAGRLAALLGARHRYVETAEGDDPGYRANAGDRCFFCKSVLLDTLLALAAAEGFAAVATGTNATDALDPFRSGIRAADARGVIAPLRAAGIPKDEVRRLARELGLPVWDKPASPCLASRVAVGIEVTPRRLRRIEDGEEAVRRLAAERGVPLRDLRVRDLGSSARVELDAAALEGLRVDDIEECVRAAGFSGEEVAVAAYRYGSLNEGRTAGA
ncbi:uncharacterized protein EV189_2993 [Motilibacter rhizosphaerae]|uniref:Asparagine synthetase domain-containing protein n=1 Tax=Motilibacter rhizosphaerae TaxID=598652 RepID=A0A4Q7NQX3_9ACTN|nr:ExsB family transcriptional regulator [Motilibacter rhizosphaerae]RZS87562.1 uncharacterized protein EV189_2993 [Motilibacter rhizosphaerae]